MTKAEELRKALNEGIVSFSYEKANGEWREAHGTCNPDGIEYVGGEAPKGTGTERTGTIAYWDMDVNGWRSCKEDKVIAINRTYTTAEWKQSWEESHPGQTWCEANR